MSYICILDPTKRLRLTLCLQLTPEEIARSKVIKFEESMAQEIQKDILKEEPLDWVKSKVHRGLYSKPFAWKKSAPCTSTYNDIQVHLEFKC